MNGKENIIANILSAAEAEKTETLQAAQEKVQTFARADAKYVSELNEATSAKNANNEQNAVSRAISLANMDAKKRILQAKQSKISEVFAFAEKNILALDDEKYLQFIISLLDKYAEDGDIVVVSEADKNRVSEEKIFAYAADKGVKLSYRADGAFTGGVILEGEIYDKNLTVSMLLNEYRESHEAEVNSILAGE